MEGDPCQAGYKEENAGNGEGMDKSKGHEKERKQKLDSRDKKKKESNALTVPAGS